MPADPKPRARVDDRDALRLAAVRPCQITGIQPTDYYVTKVDTHHLIGGSQRHDETDNLFRILHRLHMELTGKRHAALAVLVRAFMTRDQADYVRLVKGEAWLNERYPPAHAVAYHAQRGL